jgi:hypothetical protein
MSFITYEKESGRIISFIQAPKEHKDYYVTETIGSVIINGDVDVKNFGNYYIVDDAFVLRPTQATTINKAILTADGIDTIEITNSPTGIFTATNSETITGEISGSDTFATTIAGTYKITITSFPYLDFTATIEAT